MLRTVIETMHQDLPHLLPVLVPAQIGIFHLAHRILIGK